VYCGIRGRPSVLLVHDDIGDDGFADVCAFLKEGNFLVVPHFSLVIKARFAFAVYQICDVHFGSLSYHITLCLSDSTNSSVCLCNDDNDASGMTVRK